MTTTRAPCRLAVAVLLLAGCSGPSTDLAPAEQDGALLYATQKCALCHGDDGASAWWRPGPDLRPHLGDWTVDGLAAYLLDPIGTAEGIDRLAGDGMPAYEHLDEPTRRRLAAYVLALGDG